MSIIKQQTIEHYEIDLDTMKMLIAKDIGVPPHELTVEYVMGDIGPGDPMDRWDPPRGVVKIKITRTVKNDDWSGPGSR